VCDGTTAIAIFNLPAVLIIAIVTTLLVIGISVRQLQQLHRVRQGGGGAAVPHRGAAHAINPANWHPLPPQTPKDGPGAR
jgi:APA family basic amino acid/polyamine antiporter